MTIEEAKKTALIISTANGACQFCVQKLADHMNGAFPGFTWSVEMGREQKRYMDTVELVPDEEDWEGEHEYSRSTADCLPI